MKKLFSLIAVLALVCFTTMVFAAGAPKAEAAKPAAATAAAPAPAKAEVAKVEVIKGKITKIDKTANTIDVKGKTFTVKAEDIANLKKGEWVKITAAAGTMNADKIEVIKAHKAVKKAEKKLEEKKVEEKAAEKKAE
jgi:hypothetical protein